MADILQAFEWMKEGKKVKHSDWVDGSHIYYSSDTYDFRNSRGRPFEICPGDFTAEWEVYKDEENKEQKKVRRITDEQGIIYEEVSYQKYLTSKNKHRIVKSLESQYFVEIDACQEDRE